MSSLGPISAGVKWRDQISAQISADICRYLQISADICRYLQISAFHCPPLLLHEAVDVRAWWGFSLTTSPVIIEKGLPNEFLTSS
jgi:hypothetical protein